MAVWFGVLIGCCLSGSFWVWPSWFRRLFGLVVRLPCATLSPYMCLVIGGVVPWLGQRFDLSLWFPFVGS